MTLIVSLSLSFWSNSLFSKISGHETFTFKQFHFILQKFHFILHKFHFILHKFHRKWEIIKITVVSFGCSFRSCCIEITTTSFRQTSAANQVTPSTLDATHYNIYIIVMYLFKPLSRVSLKLLLKIYYMYRCLNLWHDFVLLHLAALPPSGWIQKSFIDWRRQLQNGECTFSIYIFAFCSSVPRQ